MYAKAIVRIPGENFDQGISSSGLGSPDYKKVVEQHSAYCEALRKCGLDLIILEPDLQYPDSTFVEDTAIVTSSMAVITRPGDLRRAGEEDEIGQVMQDFRKIEKILPPGHADGGDMLQVDSHFYIGISERTDREGADQLKSILTNYGFTSTEIPVGNMLHLKSGLNYIGKNTFLVREAFSGLQELGKYEKILVPPNEDYAANCVWINDYLLIPRGFQITRERLLQKGYSLIELDVSEFQKMDGGLSCLSLRF